MGLGLPFCARAYGDYGDCSILVLQAQRLASLGQGTGIFEAAAQVSDQMETLSLLLFGPAILARVLPASSFVIGGFLIAIQLGLFHIFGRRYDRQFYRMAPTFCGLLWIIFGLYESQIQAGEQTSIAPIRIDLLILVPILYVFSLLAAISLVQQIRGSAGDFREPQQDRQEGGNDQ